jgi:hypothetical protein
MLPHYQVLHWHGHRGLLPRRQRSAVLHPSHLHHARGQRHLRANFGLRS